MSQKRHEKTPLSASNAKQPPSSNYHQPVRSISTTLQTTNHHTHQTRYRGLLNKKQNCTLKPQTKEQEEQKIKKTGNHGFTYGLSINLFRRFPLHRFSKRKAYLYSIVGVVVVVSVFMLLRLAATTWSRLFSDFWETHSEHCLHICCLGFCWLGSLFLDLYELICKVSFPHLPPLFIFQSTSFLPFQRLSRFLVLAAFLFRKQPGTPLADLLTKDLVLLSSTPLPSLGWPCGWRRRRRR